MGTFLFSCASQHRIPSFPLMNFHLRQTLLSHRQPSGSTIYCRNSNLLLGEILQCVYCLQWSVSLGLYVWCTLLDLRQGRWTYYWSSMICQKIYPFLIFWSLWYSWPCLRSWYQIFFFLKQKWTIAETNVGKLIAILKRYSMAFSFLHIS